MTNNIPNSTKKNLFEKFAGWATKATGSSTAFIIAMTTVIVWALTGPVFNYSETWQLVINTGTTIITFLMVFLIQKSQNKDSKAIHLKLNELLAAHEGASNRMVDIEDINEQELDQLHKFYKRLSERAKKETDILCSHSIDAADEVTEFKLGKTSPSRRIKHKQAKAPSAGE
ncbi:MAG: low affinity iron permease family protein [Chitinophagaceae bacterium]|nr:low affinity iron permease family protein [Chitinophagaceae bacterium]